MACSILLSVIPSLLNITLTGYPGHWKLLLWVVRSGYYQSNFFRRFFPPKWLCPDKRPGLLTVRDSRLRLTDIKDEYKGTREQQLKVRRLSQSYLDTHCSITGSDIYP